MTESEVIEVAREIARSEDWQWLDPVSVWREGRLWHLETNAHAVGMNVRVVIDDASGEVLERGFADR